RREARIEQMRRGHDRTRVRMAFTIARNERVQVSDAVLARWGCVLRVPRGNPPWSLGQRFKSRLQRPHAPGALRRLVGLCAGDREPPPNGSPLRVGGDPLARGLARLLRLL